jgi:hypothetical protein
VFSVAAVPSASAGIIVTNVQVPYYEAFTLKSTASSPINGSSTLNLFKGVGNTEVVSIAGQIILTSNVGLLGVWCVDLFRSISLGGNYTYDEGAFTTNNSAPPVAPTALTATQIDNIGKLAAYGNFLMSTAPTNAKSAAIQAAIWNVEYGTTATGSAAFNTELANVMAALPTLTNPGGVALFSQKNSQGLFTSQGLYKPNSVPEPSTLIIMAFALLSLMGLRALRQQASS